MPEHISESTAARASWSAIADCRDELKEFPSAGVRITMKGSNVFFSAHPFATSQRGPNASLTEKGSRTNQSGAR